MTTIACKDNVMAADMQETWGESVKSKTHKLFRLRKGKWKGCVVGFCGASYLANVIIDNLEDGRKRRPETVDMEMEGSAEAIILAPDGIWTVNESCRPKKEVLEYYAVGSGAQGAMALLMTGKSATEAVEIMCQIDPYTSGPVEVMEGPKPKKSILSKLKG